MVRHYIYIATHLRVKVESIIIIASTQVMCADVVNTSLVMYITFNQHNAEIYVHNHGDQRVIFNMKSS